MLPRYPPQYPPSRGGHVYPQVAIATSPRALRVSKPAPPCRAPLPLPSSLVRSLHLAIWPSPPLPPTGDLPPVTTPGPSLGHDAPPGAPPRS
ncbi:uncharacterized protein N7511_011553 [Penicillium nucicola]|uniref:uncharacterized protein n=1 Tax=Penicillium nucicola TaxID=1850975 RepID=UPI002545AC5A|nr:uncharacterized protein N7511_011553 [Penicillium nucicola]KAJ5741208.1 hypothetical protein N7511_011553 [Penicillium nucicola]